MKYEDVSMFKLIQDKVGTKGFHYVPWPHATINLPFVGIFILSHNSAVMEFWPLPLEQRIKLVLNV